MSTLGWLLDPLGLYVLLAAGLSFTLYLFVSLKSEIRRLERRHQEGQRQVLALETALGEARATVLELETSLREVQHQTGMLVPPQPARSGLNLSKRTQVLRMHRAGQDGASIANVLALPRAEVELLIKVHRMVIEQA